MEAAGRTIGRYTIQSHLGSGATADVYLAQEQDSQRRVALKLLRQHFNDDETAVQRFWNEAQGATRLQHKHIVPVYAKGVADGYYYIAMRYVDGGTLDDVLRKNGTLPYDVVGRIIEQVASALDYAHSQGVIHRDIKPSNILLSGGHSTAYLADFGIARVAGRRTISDGRVLMGTPEFMSPEQVRGQQLDGKSDIYALGITAYVALTGKVPFSGVPATVLFNQIKTQPRPIRKINASIPKQIDAVVARALHKNPSRRYQRALDFAAAYRNALTPSFNTRAFAMAVGALVLVLGAVLITSQFRPISATNSSPTNPQTTTTSAASTGNTAPSGDPTSTIAPTPINAPTEAAVTDSTLAPPTDGSSSTETSPQPTGALPAIARPVQQAPAQSLEIRSSETIQLFRWNWLEPLETEMAFQLRFYQAGDPFTWQAPLPPTQAYEQQFDLSQLEGAGPFEWSIAVLDQTENTIAESFRWSLRWEKTP